MKPSPPVAAHRPVALPAATTLVSVIIPARNASATVADQLDALASQEFDQPWELIVSDNGSTDGTLDAVVSRLDRLPTTHLVKASVARGAAYARNAGIRAAAGEHILFCDADDIVSPSWIAAMVRGLRGHDLVTGPLNFSRLTPAVRAARLPRQLQARVAFGFRRFGPTGNLGVHRRVFEAIGSFDTSFRRGEDVDFSWRALEHGFDLHFEPEALVFVSRRHTLTAVFAEAFADGACQPLLYSRWGAAGMRRESLSTAVRSYAGLLRQARTQVRGARDEWWFYESGTRLGRAFGSLRIRRRYL